MNSVLRRRKELKGLVTTVDIDCGMVYNGGIAKKIIN